MASTTVRKLFNLANCVAVRRSAALKDSNARNAVNCVMQRQYGKPRMMASAAQEMSPEYEENKSEKRRGESDALSRRGRFSPLGIFGAFDSFFPNRSLLSMIDTMDRVFDEPFFARAAPASVASPFLNSSRPPWDFKETEDSYRMRIDLPGLTKDEVKVFVENGDLVIKGEHKDEESKQDSDDQWESRSYGTYSTRILLPENANKEQIKAELKNGVLFVSVPKFSEPQKNVIDIPIE